MYSYIHIFPQPPRAEKAAGHSVGRYVVAVRRSSWQRTERDGARCNGRAMSLYTLQPRAALARRALLRNRRLTAFDLATALGDGKYTEFKNEVRVLCA